MLVLGVPAGMAFRLGERMPGSSVLGWLEAMFGGALIAYFIAVLLAGLVGAFRVQRW